MARIDLLSLLRLLNRRKWVLVGVTAATVALAALVVSLLTPEYRSAGTILLESRKVRLGSAGEVVGNLIGEPPAVLTEIEVLRSTTQLGHVVDKLNLDRDPEFGVVPQGLLAGWASDLRALFAGWRQDARSRELQTADSGPRMRAVLILSRTFVISSIGRSNVISVSIDSTDPRKARLLVETAIDLYLQEQLRAKIESGKQVVELVSARLEDLRRKLEETEQAALTFRQRAGIPGGKESSLASQSLVEINSQLVQARAQRADRESRVIALRRAQQDPSAVGGVSEVLSNSLVATLRGQEADIARRVGDLSERYGADHPRLKQTRAEQAQVQARITAEVTKILAAMETDADAARAKEAQLQAQVEQFERLEGGRGQAEMQARQLERDVQSMRILYEEYGKRAKDLREQQDLQQPDARILSPATTPTGPIFPRTGVIMIMAFGGGLLLSAAVIGALERLDRGLRTGDQVERLTGQPMLGMVPRLAPATLGSATPAQYAISHPTSIYSAALRSVYTTMMLQCHDEPPKVVMVTSALPDEGKSTVAVSLASLIAASDEEVKVIVVDCDLQAPAVAHSLGVDPLAGTIQDFLSGAKPLVALLGRDATSGVHFVSARVDSADSATFFASRSMRRFVEALRATYDLVILDAPPAMADSDARVIGQLADYIAFVVRWESTPRELVGNAVKLMLDVRKRVGIVLTQVDLARHAKYGYGDHAYYYSKYQQYYRRRAHLRFKKPALTRKPES